MSDKILGGETGASFSDVLGHEHAKAHLENAIRDGHISHAYLFEGLRGVGKKTLALSVAAALFKDADSRRLIQRDAHPDLIRIRPEEGKRSISKEQIQTGLVSSIDIRPYRGTYKIYLIEEAEKLTPEAQNTMLKTIEEPPAYGVIILLSEQSASLLPTILSRVVRISLEPLPMELIINELVRRGAQPFQAQAVAAFSAGSLGNALALAGDEDFIRMRKELYDFLAAAPELSPDKVLAGSAVFETYKADTDRLLELMLLWHRDLLVCQLPEQDASQGQSRLLILDYQDALLRCASRYSKDQLFEICSMIHRVGEDLKRNVNRDLAMDMLFTMLVKGDFH